VTGSGAAGPAAVGAGVPPRGVPHSLQKRASGAFRVPQEGHGWRSGAPQLLQNFAPSGFSRPHSPQLTPARSLDPSLQTAKSESDHRAGGTHADEPGPSAIGGSAEAVNSMCVGIQTATASN
jgi:hypothetical protein